MTEQQQHIELKDKIEHVLQESRVILPGTEALLGFQLISFFSSSDKLRGGLEYWHMASLGLILTATILLLAPVAFHRIGVEGHTTRSFYLFSSRMLVVAMAALALGLSADIFVITAVVTGQEVLAALAGGVVLCLTLGLWFLYSLYFRSREKQE